MDEVVEWRTKLEAKSAQEIEDALVREAYGPPTSWRATTAANVLQAKRRQEDELRQEASERRREEGEVATLKARLTTLEDELRDKKKTLFWTRVGVIAALLAALAGWARLFFGGA